MLFDACTRPVAGSSFVGIRECRSVSLCVGVHVFVCLCVRIRQDEWIRCCGGSRRSPHIFYWLVPQHLPSSGPSFERDLKSAVYMYNVHFPLPELINRSG